MIVSGDDNKRRRSGNTLALQKAFGVTTLSSNSGGKLYRTIRLGSKITVFTVGYERRDGEELIGLLKDAGVQVLADIREKPLSRVADFRASSLQRLCSDANITYCGWPELGSTEHQRESLKQSGDFKAFESRFRRHVLGHAEDALDRLAAVAKKRAVALLCYERLHEDCHRSVVADLLADRLRATVVAL